MTTAHQNNKIQWWLIGTITSILILTASAGGANLLSREVALEDRQDAMVAQQEALDVRLSRIEGKLDILLLRSGWHSTSRVVR
jgi:hypothetical protein